MVKGLLELLLQIVLHVVFPVKFVVNVDEVVDVPVAALIIQFQTDMGHLTTVVKVEFHLCFVAVMVGQFHVADRKVLEVLSHHPIVGVEETDVVGIVLLVELGHLKQKFVPTVGAVFLVGRTLGDGFVLFLIGGIVFGEHVGIDASVLRSDSSTTGVSALLAVAEGVALPSAFSCVGWLLPRPQPMASIAAMKYINVFLMMVCFEFWLRI